MTREQIRSALTARPFVPFVLHLADGRALHVAHPEFIALSPDNRAAGLVEPDGTWHMVDLLLVPNIEFVRRRRPRRSA